MRVGEISPAAFKIVVGLSGRQDGSKSTPPLCWHPGPGADRFPSRVLTVLLRMLRR
jgi:hypothetical protein